jgi:hypothetical protein
MGFDVSDIGYFLYVDGDRFTNVDFLGEDEAQMIFKTTLIDYSVDLRWIDPALIKIRKTLDAASRPAHVKRCEYGQFLQHA